MSKAIPLAKSPTDLERGSTPDPILHQPVTPTDPPPVPGPSHVRQRNTKPSSFNEFDATEETSLVDSIKKDKSYSTSSMQDPTKSSQSGDKFSFDDDPACKPLPPLRRTKVVVLFVLVATFTVGYALIPNQELDWQQFSVSRMQNESFMMNNSGKEPILKLYLRAATLSLQPTPLTSNLIIRVKNTMTNTTEIVSTVVAESPHSAEFITSFEFKFKGEPMGDFEIALGLWARNMISFPGSFSAIPMPLKVENAVVYAGVILIAVYLLIIFELVHRAVAAMIGALAALAIMAVLNEKPDMDTVLSWVDYDTLALLFGMMVIVAILVETGIFDWLALVAYKLAKGKTWPLITMLCVFAAVVSAFLDNVTTILLLTPVTIRLCEVLDIDPKHVMIAEVMFSNIGGTATGIGDPPNVIILSNTDIQSLVREGMIPKGVDFGVFTLHMFVGSVFGCIVGYGLIRFMYRKKELLRSVDPPEVSEIVREIEIWRRTIKSMAVTSREENTVKALLQQKIATLENVVQRRRFEHIKVERGWKIQVEELEKIYFIRDKVLLAKCTIVLFCVILCFFLNSFVNDIYLTIGWIPIFGSIWLLVLSDFHDLDAILHRIEWATLIFFAALFILMEALTKMGLIAFITDQVTDLVLMVPEESRLAVALIIILWVSALASSFIDNIPYTTAMVPVIVKLSGNPDVNLPLEPLVFALAFGACFGGNGTLIGASANVVSAGIADTHGHGFTFFEFFKVGFPMMLVTTFVAMIYLLICHVAFTWH